MVSTQRLQDRHARDDALPGMLLRILTMRTVPTGIGTPVMMHSETPAMASVRAWLGLGFGFRVWVGLGLGLK